MTFPNSLRDLDIGNANLINIENYQFNEGLERLLVSGTNISSIDQMNFQVH